MAVMNSYEDAHRAGAYAKLEFPGTYYLAYRDLPGIFSRHAVGRGAVDFGCGTGRSSRFLKQCGFDVVGVDIAGDMVRLAREADPGGDYRLIENGSVGEFEPGSADLILSAFTFDNIPLIDDKASILQEIRNVLRPGGVFVNLVSSPDMYVNEWASFSTRDFPENLQARSGDKVKIIITDIDDKRPVEDVVWLDSDYRELYGSAGLELVETCKPLAKESEPYEWVNETRIAPWVIYVLKA